MSIGVVMAQRVPQEASLARQMIALLREWGVTVRMVRTGKGARSLTDLAVVHDMYLLTSGSAHLIAYATALEAAGARCVNTMQVTSTCTDRVRTIGLLAAAGVPVPQSWTAADPAGLAELVQDGPIVLKPAYRTDGPGGQVIWDVDDLIHLPTPAGPILAQRFHPSAHRDRKIYRVGEQVFGVKRTWPARSYADKVGEPFAVDREIRELTDRIGAVLGTDLFGVDMVVVDGAPIVVDVHPFPALAGVPEAALRLADYVYAVNRGTQQPGDTIGGAA